MTRPQRAHRARQPAQGGLWGRAEPLPDPAGSRRYTTTNDVELVVMVLRSALEPGYMVLGAGRRVYLRDASRGGVRRAGPPL